MNWSMATKGIKLKWVYLFLQMKKYFQHEESEPIESSMIESIKNDIKAVCFFIKRKCKKQNKDKKNK